MLDSKGALAVNIGYFTDFNESTIVPEAVIKQAGFTPVKITDISTFDLSSINTLFVNESSNDKLSSALLGRLGDITSWVKGGKSFIVHDRFVSNNIKDPQSNPFLIGASGTLVDRDFTNSADIDVIAPGNTLVTNGPNGIINNLTLDKGSSSSHGFALASTLPVGAEAILSVSSDSKKVAAFSYTLGSGVVYYSTIPLDYYLEGYPPNPPQKQLAKIYAPNVLAYVQAQRESVPEPASMLGLLVFGACGATSLLKRKQ
ncbi:PEP-CTERM sorting domain-containing protein [Nostoc favosum]|uniref:PEP-CTERM sorting domain-containing protein n=1 Tax=Nostoc favosum CHAB5714 TaxID=2780399 RepID=A0ABS8I343_9NOSO|nr:PEP-CTERM sorting domain-containing protein [Nostoc favosum]MCC5598593.1 PEP-CTERM sorting domain-containing protein [Nostoc favosum CHAB5714]